MERWRMGRETAMGIGMESLSKLTIDQCLSIVWHFTLWHSICCYSNVLDISLQIVLAIHG